MSKELNDIISKGNKELEKATKLVLDKMNPVEQAYFIVGEKLEKNLQELEKQLQNSTSDFTKTFHGKLSEVVKESQNSNLKELKFQRKRLSEFKKLLKASESLDEKEKDLLYSTLKDVEQTIKTDISKKRNVFSNLGGILSGRNLDIASLLAGAAGNNPLLAVIGKSIGTIVQTTSEFKESVRERTKSELLELRNIIKENNEKLSSSLDAFSDAVIMSSDYSSDTSIAERIPTGDLINSYSIASEKNTEVIDLLEDIKFIELHQLRILEAKEKQDIIDKKYSRLQKSSTITNITQAPESKGFFNKLLNLMIAKNVLSTVASTGVGAATGIGAAALGGGALGYLSRKASGVFGFGKNALAGAAGLGRSGVSLASRAAPSVLNLGKIGLKRLPLIGSLLAISEGIGSGVGQGRGAGDSFLRYLAGTDKSFFGNILEKSLTGAGVGSAFGGAGAIPGALIGGAAGLTGSTLTAVSKMNPLEKISKLITSIGDQFTSKSMSNVFSMAFGPYVGSIIANSKYIKKELEKRKEIQKVALYDSLGKEITPEEDEKRRQKVLKINQQIQNVRNFQAQLTSSRSPRFISKKRQQDRKLAERLNTSVTNIRKQSRLQEKSKQIQQTKQISGDMKSILLNELSNAGITDIDEQASVLAQIQAESGFIPRSENLNYSPERLLELFGEGNRFGNKVRFKTLEDARAVTSQGPEAVGNIIYGGRMGNASDEGYKFRGRGLIQLTGKYNYKKYGDLIGEDLVNNPDLANDPVIASKIASAYFSEGKKRGVDLSNTFATTKLVGPATGDSAKRDQLAMSFRKELERDSLVQKSGASSQQMNPVVVPLPTPVQQAQSGVNGGGGNGPSQVSSTRNDEPIHISILRSQYSHIVY